MFFVSCSSFCGAFSLLKLTPRRKRRRAKTLERVPFRYTSKPIQFTQTKLKRRLCNAKRR